jgi:hypothetical protein
VARDESLFADFLRLIAMWQKAHNGAPPASVVMVGLCHGVALRSVAMSYIKEFYDDEDESAKDAVLIKLSRLDLDTVCVVCVCVCVCVCIFVCVCTYVQTIWLFL